MAHLFRSCLTIGVATITAAAITIVPSVKQPAPAVPSARVTTSVVQLAAQVQPTAAIDLPNLLLGSVQRILVPPSAGQPFPTPQFPPVVAGTGIDSTIKNIYNAVEPWVQYGFELATYAVGWIPYVGWLSGQIMIFYFFGERIVRSITFNIADWLGGNVSFVQGLINVGIDTVNSFIQLGIDEWNFWLWPLPPLPPIFPFAATEATADVTVAAVAEDPTPAAEKRIAATDGVDKKKTDVDVVKEVKAPKEPKTTSSSQPAVAAQGEIRGAHTDETTEAKKVPNGNGHKKGDNGPTAGAATESSTSAATNDDAGAKRDKKNGAAKKE